MNKLHRADRRAPGRRPMRAGTDRATLQFGKAPIPTIDLPHVGVSGRQALVANTTVSPPVGEGRNSLRSNT